MFWNGMGCGPRWHYRHYPVWWPMGCGCLLPILVLGLLLMCGLLGSCCSWSNYGGYYY
jgi:hypothetical protein